MDQLGSIKISVFVVNNAITTPSIRKCINSWCRMIKLELACLPQIMNRVLPEKPSNLSPKAKQNHHWVGLLAAGCKTGNCTETFVTFSLEQDLAPKFLGVFVIPEPELALSPVDIAGL